MDATTAAAHEAPPPPSPAASDKTVIGTPVDDATYRDRDTLLEPMLGLALFSTEMGTRPQRPTPVPSDAPPIARSDPFQAVIDTALYWRKKHYRTSLAVFPYIGWKIEDLWDAEDIHVYTRKHCRDVLDYMSLDNLSAARRYAREWAQHNQEQLAKTLGQDTDDLGDLIDPANHWSLLDKVFVNGETNGWPRQFLWHVAHIMRAEILEERAKEQFAAARPAVQQPVPALTETGRADSFTTRAPPRSSLTYGQHLPAPFVPPTLPNNQLVAPPHATGGRRPPSYGPPQPGSHYGPHIGHAMAGQLPNAMGSPSMSAEVVRNPRTRPYNHNMTGGVYGENFLHTAQGAHPSRSSSVAMQSPRFNNAPMAMGPPPHMMQPHGYPHGIQGPQGPQGYQPSSPSMFPAHPYHPGLGRPGPQSQAYITSPQMAQSYILQGPNDRGPRGASFGDMTNMPYNFNNGPSHNGDSRRSGRHNSSYGSRSPVLFDPYSGTRPGFNDPNAGRKPSRGGFMDQSSRTRKPSATDNRPRTGSYSSTWVDTPSNGIGNRYPKGRTMDDPTIINDSQRGCHTKWIGPENYTVNELFVSDLPDNIQEEEVKDMFVREINITPVRVSFGKHQPAAPRQHAFVLFTTASEARLGLRLADSGPNIRGVIVRITVPRRFFQKSDDYVNHYETQKPNNKPAEERNIGGFTQSLPHEAESVAPDAKVQTTKLQYSPQDVRSHLQKTSVFSSDAGAVSPTRLDAPTITREDSPLSKAMTVREGPVQSEILSGAVEAALGLETADVSKDESEAPSDVRELEGHQSFAPAPSSETDIVEKLSVSQDIVQPTSDEANAIVGESPSQSPANEQTAKGHAHVESGTKAPFETTEANRDGDEQVPMAVKNPDAANDDDDQAKRIITSTGGKNNDVQEVDMKSATAQELGSDDEADHDASFQSAQEVVNGTELISVAAAGSPTTNHDSDIGTASAVKSSIEEENLLPQPTATDKNSQPSPVEAAQTSTTPASTVAAIDSEDKHDTVTAKGTDITKITTSKPSAVAMKVQGPQQTPSLNPFAKLSKTQRKKDKQQQKKKDPKTAKAKVGQASTAIGSSSSAHSTSTQPNVPVTSATSSSSDQSQTPAPLTPSDAQMPQATNVTKKAKADAPATNNLENEAPVVEGKGKEAVSRNQPGGATGDTTGGTGPVTQEARADQNVATPEEQNSSSALASTPNLRFAEYNGDATPTLPLAAASMGGSVKSDAAPTAPTAPKMKKTVPAVPNLKLNALSDFTREPDVASAASSDTLHPSGSAVQPSPSPTAEDFHTPLQTPAATSAPKEQVAPPKKKKNKKKKKKTDAPVPTNVSTASAPVGETSSFRPTSTTDNHNNSGGATEFDYSAHPFGGQISHIDAVRNSVKDSKTYYNQTNRELAAQTPNTDQVSISTAVDNRNSRAKANKKSDQIKDDAATRARDWAEIRSFLEQNPILGQR